MSEGQRQLAAIMFTDIVGFTSLAQRNETMAMRLLEEHRKLVRPCFAKHWGREIKTIGDAFLVEFSSALEAVRCAFELQQVLNEANSTRAPERRVLVRIGIHLGDVIHKQNDVYGDAVNVASRVEPLASPGGICITEQVYAHVKSNFEFPLLSLGKRALKNVEGSIEVYKVVLPWKVEETPAESPDKRRIAVLPLASLSPDPADEFFADGLTEELIDTLSRIRGLGVISRTSTLQYKGRAKALSEIGRDLNVGSIIEGSVRKSGDSVKVSIRMLDAAEDRHIWSETYEKPLQDIFQIQSDIAKRAADALKVTLLSEEAREINRTPTTSIEAYQSYLRGRYYLNHFRSRDDCDQSLKYFQEAVRIDPNCAVANAGISHYYHISSHENWSSPAEAFPPMKEFAVKALELDPTLAEAHGALGAVNFHYEWKWKDAEERFRRAIELRPNYAAAFDMYQRLMAILGNFERSFELMTRGAELSPQYGRGWAATRAEMMLVIGRSEEGVALLKEVVRSDPSKASHHRALGFAYSRTSRVGDAISEMRRAAQLSHEDPSFTADLALVLAANGEKDEASQILARLGEASKTAYVSLVQLACVRFALGDLEGAFKNLEEAFERRSIDLPEIRLLPEMSALRLDPRWISIETRMGLRNP